MDEQFVGKSGAEIAAEMNPMVKEAMQEMGPWHQADIYSNAGAAFSIMLNEDLFTLDELDEVAEMFCRVFTSWLNRRDVVNSNPEAYGIAVH